MIEDRHAAANGVAPSGDKNVRRILVITRDEQLLISARESLSTGRYEIESTGDRDAALVKLLGAERFGVVLCQIESAGWSALELFQLVARERPARAPRFIFAAENDGPPSARRVRDELNRSVVPKPWTSRRLRAAVSRVLESNR